jgi:tRNA (guanine37-N1)-methyltransferase
MTKFDIITIFPDQVEQFTQHGLLRIAQEKGVLINIHNLRDWAEDRHNKVDDIPFGGGPGMVMKVEPVHRAIESLREKDSVVIAMTPGGKTLTQDLVKELAVEKGFHYIILCGHYEGFDQRILDNLVDMEISIGNYILSGGEIASLVLVDTISRLLPGVLGNPDSLYTETFNDEKVDHPSYTRPVEYMGWEVPEVLRSGNHESIRQWREKQSRKLSKKQ